MRIRAGQYIRSMGLAGAVMFFVALAIYSLLFSRRTLLDITAQVQTLQLVCEGVVDLPPVFLFYGLVWLAAWGHSHFIVLMGAALLVSAVLVTAKWWVTRRVFLEYFEAERDPGNRYGWLALALSIVCSLPTPDWWLHGWYIVGQPSPNYWMNGTLLASWPFAILLFWGSYKQLQKPEKGWWLQLLLLLVLLLISKPAYVFVFVVAYPLFRAVRHGFDKEFFREAAAIFLFFILLAAAYYLIFLHSESVYVKKFNHGSASGIGIEPFGVWRLWSSNIPLSIVAGTAFPLFVTIAFWREIRKRFLFWYTWAGFFISLAIFILLIQKGEEYYTGAFRFQNYITAHLLFLVATLPVLENIRTNKPRMERRTQWAIALFFLHLLSGLVYLVKMWWTKTHY